MKPFYYYELYGQRVKSQLQLAEAFELPPFEEFDVLIDFGTPPDWVKKLSQTQCDYLTEDIMWFYLKDMLLFYVEHGNHIRITVEDHSLSELTISSYLTGSAFALLMMQKKLVPVHGSALSLNDKACILSGPSGSGKSTTALELMKQGYLFMADDIAAIAFDEEHVPLLYPGPPWQKVCGDLLTDSEKKLEYHFIDENRNKYARRLKDGYQSKPLRPTALFIILKEECPQVSITELNGIDKLHALTHNLYRGDIYHRFGISPERMQLFLNLAKELHIYHIYRPNGKDTLQQITSLIHQEFLQT